MSTKVQITTLSKRRVYFAVRGLPENIFLLKVNFIPIKQALHNIEQSLQNACTLHIFATCLEMVITACKCRLQTWDLSAEGWVARLSLFFSPCSISSFQYSLSLVSFYFTLNVFFWDSVILLQKFSVHQECLMLLRRPSLDRHAMLPIHCVTILKEVTSALWIVIFLHAFVHVEQCCCSRKLF